MGQDGSASPSSPSSLPPRSSHARGVANGTVGSTFDDDVEGERRVEDTYEAAIAGIESLDYEVIESSLYREDQARSGAWDHASYVALKWAFALLLGIAPVEDSLPPSHPGFSLAASAPPSCSSTALAAFFINVAVENLAGWKFTATFWLLRHSYAAAFIVYALFNVALVLSSVHIVTEYAPAAAGSGIPEIKGYLNGIDTPGILLLRTLLGKIFGSLGSVAGGLALGKEGPLVHTGACIASLLGQGGSTKYRITWRLLRVFQNDRDRRDLVTCGAAAGAAAAFRAPVGGVLFALEEMTSWWRSQLLWRVFFTSAIVTVVLRFLMSWCARGNCGHFGGGGFIIWDIHQGAQEDYAFVELLPMAAVGIIGGILGALFNQLTFYLSSWRRNSLHPQGNHVKVIEACTVALLTTALSFGMPMLTKCRPCPDPKKYPLIECPRPQRNYGNFVNFYCQNDGEYNDLATIFFNTQDDAIRNLFSSNTHHEYSAHTLVTFLVTFFGLAVITYGTAVPSGQFVPGIMIGSTYGRLVGMVIVRLYSKDTIEEGTYALLGAASFLAGSMRMTVSLCVIMVEITNNLKLLPLIMLVVLISKAVGDAFTPGFYDVHASLKQIPILESQPKRFMGKLSARDAITKKAVIFSRLEQVGHLLSVLRSTQHNGFPVVEDLGEGKTALIGLILRSHLVMLLKSRADFQQTDMVGDTRGRIPFRYDITDFAKPASTKGLAVEDVQLSEAELAMWLDLKPFLNPTPYIVDEDVSVTKAYMLFRQLGLRHLCVVPKPLGVLGVITRKDLLHEVLEERIPDAAHNLPQKGLNKAPSFLHRPDRRQSGDYHWEYDEVEEMM
eukprot:SM000076S21793  [mRNA]  locus=s76:235730:243321:- [translate_table: standard]